MRNANTERKYASIKLISTSFFFISRCCRLNVVYYPSRRSQLPVGSMTVIRRCLNSNQIADVRRGEQSGLSPQFNYPNFQMFQTPLSLKKKERKKKKKKRARNNLDPSPRRGDLHQFGAPRVCVRLNIAANRGRVRISGVSVEWTPRQFS